MKKGLTISTLFALLLLLLGGCKKDSTSEPAQGSTGSADFSRFVTIGNSITAGYQSGSLFKTAQLNAFGSLIAQQVKTGFQEPLVADPGTAGRMELNGLTSAGDPIININMSSGSPENLNYPAPYNNLGVPGATVYDVLNATNQNNCYSAVFGKTPNPMFDLVLRNSALNLGSQFSQAKALKPTFVTLWIGNNDVLGYATAGGTVPFTPISNFTALYKATLDSLATLNAGVVVANIPDVTSIPFFTTVGPSLVKKGYPAYVWAQGSDNKVMLMSLEKNYITLQAAALLTNASTGAPTGIGLTQSNPFPNKVVLDSAEAAAALKTIADYNSAISTLAQSKGFAVVDINTLFNGYKKADAQGGTNIDGVTFKTDYITGGLFSLDGVHPTSRAQGLVANEFIRVINAKYGASIPAVNIQSISPTFMKVARRDYFGIPVVSENTFSNLLF